MELHGILLFVSSYPPLSLSLSLSAFDLRSSGVNSEFTKPRDTGIYGGRLIFVFSIFSSILAIFLLGLTFPPLWKQEWWEQPSDKVIYSGALY